MNEQQAKQHVNELKGFYGHLGAFVGVNLFLFVINVSTSPNDLWFIYPLFGWGIGLIAHAVQVFGASKNWEARKMEQLTGLSQTKDQLETLSERTETLIKILASFDWEKIDPDLFDSKENLQKAKRRLAELQTTGTVEDQKLVEQEIEKLEKFVTSAKFNFYDQASK